jgi:hypothetical protein
MQPSRLVSVALFTFLSASTVAAATYTNAKYGYSVTYPVDQLKPLPEPVSGDGITMKARTGQAEVRVWGEYNVLPYSPEDIARMAEKDCPNHRASYRVAKANLVAVSCAVPSAVLYQKTLIRGDRMATLWARYPSSETNRWDAVIAQMATSLAINLQSY